MNSFWWSMLAFALCILAGFIYAITVTRGGSIITPAPVPMKMEEEDYKMANDINVGELTPAVIQIKINDSCFLNLSKEEAQDLMCQLAKALGHELICLK